MSPSPEIEALDPTGSVQNQSFAINAQTCTLRRNSQLHGGVLLDGVKKYVIPIYQRPYSWTDGQIKKFISDIFVSYWGSDATSLVREPMFIGTMQLSTPNEGNEQQIIDGQQRLTTFLLLIKALQLRFSQCAELHAITLDWLTTKVNNGKQQSYMESVLSNDLAGCEDQLNPYLRNARFIAEIMGGMVDSIDGEEVVKFDIDDFIEYLVSHVYFVVIETRAGLTKTLQIFNAINTTGLDLNGGDIFKIKMYEYLTKIGKHDETAFNDISALYKKIDDYNAERKEHFIGIHDVLRIYQYVLIAKFELPNALYAIGADTFFERLFDTLLQVNQWEYFRNNASRVALAIEDLDSIIEARYEWQCKDYASVEDACAMHFIWWSRYSRYWILNFVFLYRFRADENHWEKLLVFNRQLSKLYFIYSIRFQKSVNEMHTFTYSLVKAIIHKPFEEVMERINKKIGKLGNHKGWYDLEHTLNGNIAHNSKMKNLLCRLSAMLEEDYRATDQAKIHEIRSKLFDSPIDIEHIQSYHDKDGKVRQDIWDAWGVNINSLGNLMVLEQKINRSISNNPYNIKMASYTGSQFLVVTNHVAAYQQWNLQNCLDRKTKEINKIVNYLFQ